MALTASVVSARQRSGNRATIRAAAAGDWREAQFEESSRLRHETPCAVGSDSCHNDIKFTAGTPFTATLRLTFFWR